MGSVVSPLFSGFDRYGDLPHASSLCGACREVCPVRIDLPGLLLRLRRDTVKKGHNSPWWLKLGLFGYRTAAKSPMLFGLGSSLAGFGSGLVSREGWMTSLPVPLNGWTDSRDFPKFASKSFQTRWKERQARKAQQGGGR